jgi:uncharacterized membrane protein YedE/YeeE
MIELLKQPWPWYVAGPIIALVMFLLLYFGKNFGMSANLRTMCSIAGGGRVSDFFRFDWKGQRWNLVFVLGAVLGGFLSANFLSNGEPIDLAESTVEALSSLGFQDAGKDFLPSEIFSMEQLMSVRGILLLLVGGFLVGFGARYAGGCTSGHAISGLSDLQLPSLIAVIGFFIGGLAMVHFIIPLIF